VTAWLLSTWNQTWPNLLANVLWVPVAWLHHRGMKRHVGNVIKEANDASS
jgi:hypothetical protein